MLNIHFIYLAIHFTILLFSSNFIIHLLLIFNKNKNKALKIKGAPHLYSGFRSAVVLCYVLLTQTEISFYFIFVRRNSSSMKICGFSVKINPSITYTYAHENYSPKYAHALHIQQNDDFHHIYSIPHFMCVTVSLSLYTARVYP
jgi:hypothetical protein